MEVLNEENKLNTNIYLSNAYMSKGSALDKLNQSEKSIEAYDKAIKILKMENKSSGCADLVNAYECKGFALDKLGESEKAIEEYTNIINLMELQKLEDKSLETNLLANAYMNRGIALMDLSYIPLALEDALRAMSINKNNANEPWISEEDFIKIIHMVSYFSSELGYLGMHSAEILSCLEVLKMDNLSEISRTWLDEIDTMLKNINIVDDDESLEKAMENAMKFFHEITVGNEKIKATIKASLMMNKKFYGIYFSESYKFFIILRFNISNDAVKFEILEDKEEYEIVMQKYQEEEKRRISGTNFDIN